MNGKKQVFSKFDSDDKRYGEVTKQHPHTGLYTGITDERSTTDRFPLLLLLFSWVAMTYIGCSSMKGGDPYGLIFPRDYRGSVCGQAKDMKNFPDKYPVFLNGDGVCVDGCPTRNAPLDSVLREDYVCAYYVSPAYPTATAFASFARDYCFSNGVFDISRDCGCILMYQSTPLLRRCQVNDDEVRSKIAYTVDANLLRESASDLFETYKTVLSVGLGGTLFLCFMFSYFMKQSSVTKSVIWCALSVVLPLALAVAVSAWTTAGRWEAEDPPVHPRNSIVVLRATAIIMCALALVWTCLVVFMHKKIDLAVKCVHETAATIQDIPWILFTPLVNTFFLCVFLLTWTAYFFYQATSGTFTSAQHESPFGETYQTLTFHPDSATKMKLGFLVFCLLWTIFFFAAFSNLFTSLATASHYFLSPGEREKSSMKLLFTTYFTTIRFHLGTAALGSLVLTLVSVLRFWVNYMLKYQDSRCGRFLGLLMRCLLASMQRCLRFLDRTAYVQTAIHGTGFYRSCINGFFVVARNVYTIGVVAAVSSITLLIGKVSIVFMASCTTYFIMQRQEDILSGIMLPVLLTALISWTVASLFMDIFSSIIDTLLVCYITEEESLSFVGSRPHRSRRRTSAAVRHFVCEVDTLSLYPESVTALSPLKPGKNEHQGKSSSSNIPMKATLKMRAAEQRAQERAMQEQLRATDALSKAREAVLGGGGLELEMGRSGQCESGQHESWDSPTSPMLADCQSTEKRTPLRARRSEGTARRDGALVSFFEGSPSSTGSYSPVVVA